MLRNACFGNTQKELYNPTEQRFQHYTPRRPGTPPPPHRPPAPPFPGGAARDLLFIYMECYMDSHTQRRGCGPVCPTLGFRAQGRVGNLGIGIATWSFIWHGHGLDFYLLSVQCLMQLID